MFDTTPSNYSWLLMRQELMHKKLAYLRPVFLKKNDYPLRTIKLLIKKVKESQKQKEVTQIS